MPRFVPSTTGAPGGGAWPDMASNSPNQYSPQLFASQMLRTYYEDAVALGLCNTTYESDIKNYGDSVVVRRDPRMSIFDHVPGQNIEDDYETPTADSELLEINQSLGFAFAIDAIQEKQTDFDVNAKYGEVAGKEMAVELDRRIFSRFVGTAAASNRGTTAGAISGDINLGAAGVPLAVTKDNAVDVVLALTLALDEVNMTQEGRWLAVPAWFFQVLKQGPLSRVDVTGDSTSPLRNGEVGMIDNVRIHRSNQLPVSGAETSIFCGVNDAHSFAGQVLPHTMETFPDPKRFGTLGRGMNVWGSKTLEPLALTEAIVTKG